MDRQAARAVCGERGGRLRRRRRGRRQRAVLVRLRAQAGRPGRARAQTQSRRPGKVANLQAESGKNIAPWGVTGDNGTAFRAAQWRGDRFNALQKYAADHGLDYRSTQAQQGFMRQEYLGPERKAYDALLAARTPQSFGDRRQQALRAIGRQYWRARGQCAASAQSVRGPVMATIPKLQIPQMGAVSGGADFSPLAQLAAALPEVPAGPGQQGGVRGIPADRRSEGAAGVGRHEPGAARHQRAEPYGCAEAAGDREQAGRYEHLAINQAAFSGAAADWN